MPFLRSRWKDKSSSACCFLFGIYTAEFEGAFVNFEVGAAWAAYSNSIRAYSRPVAERRFPERHLISASLKFAVSQSSQSIWFRIHWKRTENSERRRNTQKYGPTRIKKQTNTFFCADCRSLDPINSHDFNLIFYFIWQRRESQRSRHLRSFRGVWEWINNKKQIAFV